MLKRRNKSRTGLGVGKSGNRILRLLRPDKSCEASLSLKERDQENGFEGSWREIGNALLEAECNRTQALLRWQQNNQRFY